MSVRINIFPPDQPGMRGTLVVRGTFYKPELIHDEIISVTHMFPDTVELGMAYRIIKRKLQDVVGTALIENEIESGD